MVSADRALRSVRRWVAAFIAGLVLSGITAFPLTRELHGLLHLALVLHVPAYAPSLATWLLRVGEALDAQARTAPFLAYGTDWLAFGHLVIALAFAGLWSDPVRNRWLVSWGLMACAGVLPLALIAGWVRGIPLYWRCIDCCFGVFGCLTLLRVRRLLFQLEQTTRAPEPVARS